LTFILKKETKRAVEFGEIKLTAEQIEKLEKVSSATIDRKLVKKKKEAKSKLYTMTKPGYMLKSEIEVKPNSWNDRKIGFAEIDLVAHCGSSACGQFINTLSFVDVKTGWWEGFAVMGKSAIVVNHAIEQIRKRLPFKLKGIDSDNGSEFINEMVNTYCKKLDILFTRGRSGRKNDNCHVEEKNWTHVRKILGYKRFDTNGELKLINDLYEILRLYYNFFLPTYKLESKTYNNSKRQRTYEKELKTPYKRILESDDISTQTKEKLTAVYNSLNPFDLKRKIDKLLFVLGEFNSRKSDLINVVNDKKG
jgi:hypothetical protein